MSEVTVTQFADALKIPVEKLLAQLGEAGISVEGADAVISDDAKQNLLTHLRRTHGHDDSSAAAAATAPGPYAFCRIIAIPPAEG